MFSKRFLFSCPSSSILTYLTDWLTHDSSFRAIDAAMRACLVRYFYISIGSPNSTVLHLDIYLLCKYTNLKDTAGQSARVKPMQILLRTIASRNCLETAVSGLIQGLGTFHEFRGESLRFN